MIEAETTEQRKVIKPKGKGIVAIALFGLIISILIGFFVYEFTSGYFASMAMVKKASNKKKNVEVMLPDGSKVWLNSNSEIRFPKEFGPNKREVFFEGEGFFAVVKNEEKPFILHSINSRVEIVGTTFNLRAYPKEKELILSVVSGEVILFDKNSDKNAIQLENDEQGIFDFQSGKISRRQNHDINFLAWQTGKFFFKNATLSEVSKKLIAYYNKQIVFENEGLKNCRISLELNNKTLQGTMEEIRKTLPISYEEVNGKIIITGNDCKN